MAKERTYVNGTIGDQSIEALIARHKTKLLRWMAQYINNLLMVRICRVH